MIKGAVRKPPLYFDELLNFIKIVSLPSDIIRKTGFELCKTILSIKLHQHYGRIFKLDNKHFYHFKRLFIYNITLFTLFDFVIFNHKYC